MHPPLKNFYDRSTGSRLAGAAAAAYGREKGIQDWADAMGCGVCEILRDEAAGTLVFVARGADDVFVCFRGTADLRNWLADLDCRRRRWSAGGEMPPDVEVHEGFQRDLSALWPRLKTIIDTMMGGCERIWFTGHSLGGALAMLAAARWQCEAATTSQPWVYTFGQPRAGNAAWARWYNARLKDQTFRVIHADDIIVRVPWLLGFYRHAGSEVFYPDGVDSSPAHPYPATFRENEPLSLALSPLRGARESANCAGAVSGCACSALPAPYLVDASWWRKAGADMAGLWQEWRQGQLALLAGHHINTYLRLFDPVCGVLPAPARSPFHAPYA